MAYPTVSAPYGFKPVNRIDGLPYAGATRQLGIASGTAAIYNGDLVTLGTGGVVTRFAGTTTGSMVGVFVGCTYINPTNGQPTYSQNWPDALATTGAVAYVVDDPMALFKVVATNGSSVVPTTATAPTRAYIGANIAVVSGSGSATTGDSTMSVLIGSEDTTAALPIRVIDLVPDTAYAVSSALYYPELLVKLNTHQYNNTTGV